MSTDEGVDEPRWRLVPVKGNMKELFEGEDVLAASSDAEEDTELEKKPLFVYESWLAEAARKKVWRCVALSRRARAGQVQHARDREARKEAARGACRLLRCMQKVLIVCTSRNSARAASSGRTKARKASPVLRASSRWIRRRQSVCSRRRSRAAST